MNITIELITPSTFDTGNETSMIGPSESNDLNNVIDAKQDEINTKKRKKDKKQRKKENKGNRKKQKSGNKEKKTEEQIEVDVTSDKAILDTTLIAEVNNTTSVPVHTESSTISTISQNLKMNIAATIITPTDMNNAPVMTNHKGIKIVTPEFIRKLQESLQAKLDRIKELGRPPKTASTTVSTKPKITRKTTTVLPTVKDSDISTSTDRWTSTTGGSILGGNVTTATEQSDLQTKNKTNVQSSTVTTTTVNLKESTTDLDNSTRNEPTTQQLATVSQENTSLSGTTISNGFQGNITISNVNGTSQFENKNETSIDTKPTPTPEVIEKSGLVIVTENKDKNSTHAHDIDIIIFPSSRTNIKKRKRERKKFCRKINFGTAAKGFNCCKKTLNCFDDLPETLDETIFHHANPQYNEAERLHVCHDIDESLECIGEVLSRPNCKGVGPIMDEKIKPQLDKIKLFYYKTCNRSTSLSPSAGPNPTSPVFPAPPPLVPGTGGKGSDHYHAPANSYAPFIGGAIMGVFALVVIILFAVYCRKRTTKNKRNRRNGKDKGPETTQSSRYKTVSYNRRKSDVYAEIDEKSMISTISYNVDGNLCSNDGSCGSMNLSKKVEMDNHGYLSPRSSLPEDELNPDIIGKDTHLFTHGYIELKSESGESAQSYAKLEAEPEEDYIQPDQIEGPPLKTSKKPEEQSHMYFVLEKENKENEDSLPDLKDLNY